MGIIDDIMSEDARYGFFEADAMPGVESLTYRKKDGTTRAIKAQVDRQPPERLLGDGYFTAAMEIAVRNSTTGGITAAELDVGGDQIQVAYRYGGTAEWRHIVGEPVVQDAGSIRVMLR